jgi:rod shape-determining protein MreB
LKTAGDHFDEIIARHIRRNHQVVIGQSTAEDIKIQIGSVLRRNEELFMEVKGRDAKSGRPRSIEVNSTEICGVLYRPALRIAEAVSSILEDTSPELVGDLNETGIVLTGGGSQLWGMDLLLQKELGIPCTIADDPASCVAYGCGKSLAWITRMTDGPANIARKRLMRG